MEQKPKSNGMATLALMLAILALIVALPTLIAVTTTQSEIDKLKTELQSLKSTATNDTSAPINYEMSIGELQITTKDGTQISLKDFKANGNKETIDQIFNGLEIK